MNMFKVHNAKLDPDFSTSCIYLNSLERNAYISGLLIFEELSAIKNCMEQKVEMMKKNNLLNP